MAKTTTAEQATADPAEVVYMTHPDSGPITTTSRAAYDGLWKAKGWQESNADDYAAQESGQPAPEKAAPASSPS